MSIKVVAKVSRMRLYLEVIEKVGQADLYTSNLLTSLEDSGVKAMVEYIEVAGKLDTAIKVVNIVKIIKKLNSQNLKIFNS